jgi:O-antigen/teichoic acid export membrane protein
MAYWVLAARYYSPEVVGLNSAALSAMGFVAGMSQLSLPGALIRFVPRAGKATRRLLGFAYLISVTAAAIAASVFMLGLNFWSPALGFLRANSILALWFLIATMAWTIFDLQDSALTGLRQAIWVPIENTLFAIVKILLLVLLVHQLPGEGILISWTVSLVLTLIPVNLLIFRRLVPNHITATHAGAEPLVPKQVAEYAAGNYLGALFSLSTATLLPIIVTQSAGASTNAFFYQPWTISNSLLLIAFNMTRSLTVEAAVDQSKLGTYGYQTLMHTARLVVPAVVVIVAGAPFILGIFGPAYATEGTMLLRLLALATVPNIINVLYLSVARVQRRMSRVVAVQGVLCVLILSMSYILLGKYGIVGVGIACLIGQSLVAAALLLTWLRPIVNYGNTK